MDISLCGKIIKHKKALEERTEIVSKFAEGIQQDQGTGSGSCQGGRSSIYGTSCQRGYFEKVRKYSKVHLPIRLKIMLPDVLKSLGMTQFADLKDVTHHCEDLEKEHKDLIAKVPQSASAAYKTSKEIQGNITSLLNGHVA